MADTKTIKEVEALVGDVKSEVEELASQTKELEDAKSTHAQLVNGLMEKYKDLEKHLITEGEVSELAEKMGTELTDLQAQIRKIRNAKAIEGGRESFFSWKSRIPGKIGEVFDEAGRALPEVQQRAYHLFQAPVKYEGDLGRRVKQLRDLHDSIYVSDAYFRQRARSNYNITHLKSWGIFQDLASEIDPEFGKAMASTTVSHGDEWVPTNMSSEYYDAYRLASLVENFIPHWSMPSNPAVYPILTTRPTMYRASQATTNNPSQLTKSDFGTGNTTFTAETFAVCVPVSPEFIEDSIIAVVPALREQLATAASEGFESMLINGDDSATHQDTAADWATDTAYPESYEKGFRFMALNASATQAFNTQSTSAGVGDATAAFTAEDCRYNRELLPSAYSHRAADLVHVTSLAVWIKMLSFAQYSQPGTYGANASWLTGDMPTFDGSDLVLSSQLLETMDANGLKTGSGSGHTHKGFITFNRKGFMVGEKRGATLEFEKNILTQQWAFVLSERKSFQPMMASTAAPVAYAYNIE